MNFIHSLLIKSEPGFTARHKVNTLALIPGYKNELG